MTFRPSLADATSRVRLFIGDTAATPLMPGGVSTYKALAADYASDEPGYALAAAKMLRASLALQPTLVSGGGESVQFGNLIAHLDDIIAGRARYPWATGGSPTGGLRGLHVGGSTLRPAFRRDGLGTDPTLEQVPGDEGDDDAA